VVQTIPDTAKPDTAPGTIDTYKLHVVRSVKRKAPAAKRMHVKPKQKHLRPRECILNKTKAPAAKRMHLINKNKSTCGQANASYKQQQKHLRSSEWVFEE
jgi:hypothetical protein